MTPRLGLALSLALVLASGCAARGATGNRGPGISGQADSHQRAEPATSSRAVRALQNDLTRVFGAPIMARGTWGVDVRSLATGERLFELNAGRLMMPASNMKIVTVAVAAETLGWDHRFATTLQTTAGVVNGVLAGDLIVRGEGDPTINTRNGRAALVIDEWVAALKSHGITRIEGRIIGDDQAFDDEGIGAGWSWDYLQFGYAAPVGALQFNENIATLTTRPAVKVGDFAEVSMTPGAGFTIVNRVSTGATGTAASVAYRRRIDAPVLEVTGTVAAGSAAVERSVAVVNPTVFFAQALKDGLTARGIDVAGSAVDFDDVAAEFINAPERRTLAATNSPTLREIATVVMKVSQNLYAETLLKAAGRARGGLGTFEEGLTTVRGSLAAWGVPGDGYIIADGSGLSRYNYLAASTIADVLVRQYKNDATRDPFVATLPIAGKDGSTSTRMRRTRAEGNAVAKTGSIANVRALSGFVKTRDGEMLVFAIVANDFVIEAATVNWMTDLAVEHLANFTRQ